MGPSNWRQALELDLETLDVSVRELRENAPKDVRRCVYLTYQECWEEGLNIPSSVTKLILWWIPTKR